MPFLTPETLGGEPVCYPILIPPQLYPYLQGALLPLSLTHQWEQHGAVSPQDTADYFTELLAELDRGCPVNLPRYFHIQPSDQSIPNATWTGILGSGHNSDTGTFQVLGGADIRVLVPGVYLLSVSVAFASNATGVRYAQMFSVNDNYGIATARVVAASGDLTTFTASGTLRFTSGTRDIRPRVFQNSGVAINLLGPALPANYSIIRISN